MNILLLMMEAASISEKSGKFYEITQRYIEKIFNFTPYHGNRFTTSRLFNGIYGNLNIKIPYTEV
jgi:hypothetical protein